MLAIFISLKCSGNGLNTYLNSLLIVKQLNDCFSCNEKADFIRYMDMIAYLYDNIAIQNNELEALKGNETLIERVIT